MFALKQKTKKTHWLENSSPGITLLEVLLVMTAIGILTGLMFAALNPAKFFQDYRDRQREVHIHDLQVAFAQLLAEEEGIFPEGITVVPKEICDTGKTPGSADPQPDCGNLVNLSMLVPTYISQIPKDPQGGITARLAPAAYAQSPSGTGYFIGKGEANRLVIQAPRSETRPVGLWNLYNPYSLGFDGSSGYVEIGNVNYDYPDFTVSIWARSPTNDPSSPGFPIHVTNLVGKGNWNSQNNWYIGYKSSGSNPATHVSFVYGIGWSLGPSYSVNNFDLSKWNHFVGVATADKQVLYLNNVEVGYVSTAHESVLNDLNLQIGRSSYTSRFFDGKIDKVRIYNRALSEQEIQNLHNGIHIPSGLVGWWNFNEGEGITTEDLSGNGNHGTLNGGVIWSEDTP